MTDQTETAHQMPAEWSPAVRDAFWTAVNAPSYEESAASTLAFAQLLAPAAATPAVDWAALRDRIADVLSAADGWQWVTDADKARSSTYRSYQSRADAVLAVLPDTGRNAECRECNDTGACNGGPCPLRRLADETPDTEEA